IRESGLRRFLALAQGGIEPGPSEGPVAIGGTADDAKSLGCLIEREPREEPELDQLGTGRIFLRQLVQSVVEDEKLVRGFGEREFDVFEAQSPPTAAALEPAPLAGTVDEDAAHGLCGGGKEMSAALPELPFTRFTAPTRRHHEPEIGLMNQGGGLQRLTGQLLA